MVFVLPMRWRILSFKIITMNPKFYPVPTIAPKVTHDLTKNLLLCIDHYIVNTNIYYFPQKSYSSGSGQWVITYNWHYKVQTKKDSDIKYLIFQCGK